MALKIVNTESLDAVADALNEAAGKSGKLVFPDEYISTAKGLSAGGGGGNPLQKFIDDRGDLTYLYGYFSSNARIRDVKDEALEWLTTVDLSKMEYANYMFYRCESRYWTKIPLFDTSNIKYMTSMFESTQYDRDRYKAIYIPNFDTRNAMDMGRMFYYRHLKNFPQLDMSKASYISYMYDYAKWDEPLSLPSFIASYPTVAEYLFANTNIKDVGTVELNNCEKMSGMFNMCASLESVGKVKSERASVNTNNMFSSCSKLVSIGEIALKSNDISNMFKNCTSLTEIPSFDGGLSTYASYFCDGCTSLVTVGSIDVRSVTSFSYSFRKCTLLTNLTLKNIKANLQVGSGDGSGSSDYGHLLTVDSLVGLCYELRDTGSVKTLTIGAANLAKLASVYVRLVEITDEMRAEDDLIDKKLPFERCESTDEGATLIGDYVILKNWKLA